MFSVAAFVHLLHVPCKHTTANVQEHKGVAAALQLHMLEFCAASTRRHAEEVSEVWAV